MKEHGLKFFAMGVALAVTLLFPLVSGAQEEEPITKIYGGPQEKPEGPESGIYVGILSFSDDVTELAARNLELGTIAADDKNTTDPILRALYDYAPVDPRDVPQSDNIRNAAMLYAVNKAMADLVNAEKNNKIPSEVDSVYIVTITGSHDTGSAYHILREGGSNQATERVGDAAFPEELKPNPLDIRNPDAYSAFINKKLRETIIRGKHIQAYSLSLRDTAWQTERESIATERNYVTHGSLNDLTNALSNITVKMNKVNDKMTLTAVLRAPFSGERIRFNIDGKNYIDGTVYQNKGWSIIDITSEPKELYEPDSVRYIPEGRIDPKGDVSFNFTINNERSFDKRQPEKVFKEGQRGNVFNINPNNKTLGTRAAQLYVQKNLEKPESVVVYFILDETIKEDAKVVIRDSLIKNINYLKAGSSNP
ncbi:hypothetical protein FACS1894137_15450 [Spirochaetia bacterium]|nr:hypothetical protein FACS1894137_15450 [Spirochaetia bacterium]